MTAKTDPYLFTNGTVANALEVNARFDELYDLQNGGIDADNMDLTAAFAWTGTHSWTTATWLNVTSTTTQVFQFQSNDSDAATADIDFYRNSSTAASSDNLWAFHFYGNDDGGTKTEYARIQTLIRDATDGNEEASIYFYTATNGTLLRSLAISGESESVLVDNNYDLIVSSGAKVRFDGSATGDTYLTEFSSDIVYLYTGGDVALKFGTAGIAVSNGDNLYLDGSLTGDTYLTESSGNVVDLYTGGVLTTRFRNYSGTGAEIVLDPATGSAIATLDNSDGSTYYSALQFKKAGVVSASLGTANDGTDNLVLSGSSFATELWRIRTSTGGLTTTFTGTTSNGLDITADSLTTGVGFSLVSDSSDSSTRNLFQIVNDNTGATGTVACKIRQDAANYGFFLDHNAAAYALYIDHDFSSSSDFSSILIQTTNTGAGEANCIKFGGSPDYIFDFDSVTLSTFTPSGTPRAIPVKYAGATFRVPAYL